MWNLVEIYAKNSNTVSYYVTDRKASELNGMSWITHSIDSNIIINIHPNITDNGVHHRAYNIIPHNIRLIDEKLRHIDIVVIFDTKWIERDIEELPYVDEHLVKRIISECAFNEQYCNYICDLIENLSKISKEEAEIAVRISETILPKAIKLLEDHSKLVTEAFEKYKANGYKLDCELQEEYPSNKDLRILCNHLDLDIEIYDDPADNVYACLFRSENGFRVRFKEYTAVGNLHSLIYHNIRNRNSKSEIETLARSRFLEFYQKRYLDETGEEYPSNDDIDIIIKILGIKIDFCEDIPNKSCYAVLVDANTNTVSRSFCDKKSFYEFLNNRIAHASAQNVEEVSVFNRFREYYVKKFVQK